MPQDKTTSVLPQTQFYRNNFRRLLVLMFVLLGLAYILLGIIVYQHFTRPDPNYFVSTSDGRLIEITPAGN